MDNASEYLSLGEAAEVLGVDRRRLRLLIERQNVETIEDPLDFRKRLVSRDALEHLTELIGNRKKAVA